MNNHNSLSNLIFVLLIVGVVLLVLFFIKKHFKKLVMPNVYLITGAVKSGKSLLSVHLAIKEYKSAVFWYKFKKFFATIFHLVGDDYPLCPMLYSNIPLSTVKFNRFTFDILYRKVRIPDKSVVLLDEISLLADSMMCKDKNINASLMAFVKLFAHYTHGGKLIMDTQSISDCHFSFKRCMNSYLYIYTRQKLPFFTIMQVREMLYSDDGSMVNNASEDIELTMRKILLWNTTYDKYDSYCYSSFTDYLAYQVDYDVDTLGKDADLKVYEIVSLQSFANDMNKQMKMHLESEKC